MNCFLHDHFEICGYHLMIWIEHRTDNYKVFPNIHKTLCKYDINRKEVISKMMSLIEVRRMLRFPMSLAV